MTDFVETNALLAALSDDNERLDEIVGGMLPGERTLLAEACARVARLCAEMNLSDYERVQHLKLMHTGLDALRRMRNDPQ